MPPRVPSALVTGGGGFIGSHLVDRLLADGTRVTVLDDFSTGKRSNLGAASDAVVVEGSVLDPAALTRAIAGADTVFHLAAQVSVPESAKSPEASFRLNAEGTLAVLEAAKRADVRRFVYSASSARYGETDERASAESDAQNALSVYAAGKLAGEHLVSAYSSTFQLSGVSLVYFNIFGPRQRPDSPYAAAVPIFISRMRACLPITVYGDGTQTRDFTFISNVVHANILAAAAVDLNGESVNIAGGTSISVNELVSAIAAELGVTPSVEFAEPRTGEVKHSRADVSAARRLLGYVPVVDWREGLRRTISTWDQS